MTLKAHQQESGHTVLEQYAFMKRDYAVNLDDSGSPPRRLLMVIANRS
ncbi:hypothetical protein O9992_22200 [Vibrio lentus]|nr:hypothetical protein [Vibrio lentus]